MPYWLLNTVWIINTGSTNLTYELFNKTKIVKKQILHPMTNQPQNDSTSVMPKENK